MTGEHGGCCCNHDKQNENPGQNDNRGQNDICGQNDNCGQNGGQRDKGVQAPPPELVTDVGDCCGGAMDEETSRSNDQADHSSAARHD